MTPSARSKKKSNSSPNHPQESTPAARPMPSLVFNEIRFANDNLEQSERKKPLSTNHPQREPALHPNQLLPTNNPTTTPGAWKQLWLAVTVVMIVVLGVWIFSLPQKLNLSTLRSSNELQLMTEAKERWDARFNATATNSLLNEVDVSPLAQALAAFSSTSVATTTLTNSTSPVSPSSTNILASSTLPTSASSSPPTSTPTLTTSSARTTVQK